MMENEMNELKTYTFHRMHNGQMMFYPVQYESDEKAIEGAMSNPGTTMVCRAKDGVMIYPKPEHKQ